MPSNDNRDPYKEFNRRVQRRSDRRQNQLGWTVVILLAVAITAITLFLL